MARWLIRNCSGACWRADASDSGSAPAAGVDGLDDPGHLRVVQCTRGAATRRRCCPRRPRRRAGTLAARPLSRAACRWCCRRTASARFRPARLRRRSRAPGDRCPAARGALSTPAVPGRSRTRGPPAPADRRRGQQGGGARIAGWPRLGHVDRPPRRRPDANVVPAAGSSGQYVRPAAGAREPGQGWVLPWSAITRLPRRRYMPPFPAGSPRRSGASSALQVSVTRPLQRT